MKTTNKLVGKVYGMFHSTQKDIEVGTLIDANYKGGLLIERSSGKKFVVAHDSASIDFLKEITDDNRQDFYLSCENARKQFLKITK